MKDNNNDLITRQRVFSTRLVKKEAFDENQFVDNENIDIRNLVKSKWSQLECPIKDCNSTLEIVPSQWGDLPYCPIHKIRIHKGSQTFVYYNGPDAHSKQDAALRNIISERKYFKKHILCHSSKAESYRFCNETSEDALTWNVFSSLAKEGLLSRFLKIITKEESKSEPELYLWGLRVNLVDDSLTPIPFAPLLEARNRFEPDISTFNTEPDIMLYVPGQFLVLIEAKFTSGNTLATSTTNDDHIDMKPKSREGIIKRYSSNELENELLSKSSIDPFYSQLYRNLVFGIQMAKEKNGEKWFLVNLVSKRQSKKHRESTVAFADPTQFIYSLLPEKHHCQFRFYNWEQLYSDLIEKSDRMNGLAEYMYYKSANGSKALDI